MNQSNINQLSIIASKLNYVVREIRHSGKVENTLQIALLKQYAAELYDHLLQMEDNLFADELEPSTTGKEQNQTIDPQTSEQESPSVQVLFDEVRKESPFQFTQSASLDDDENNNQKDQEPVKANQEQNQTTDLIEVDQEQSLPALPPDNQLNQELKQAFNNLEETEQQPTEQPIAELAENVAEKVVDVKDAVVETLQDTISNIKDTLSSKIQDTNDESQIEAAKEKVADTAEVVEEKASSWWDEVQASFQQSKEKITDALDTNKQDDQTEQNIQETSNINTAENIDKPNLEPTNTSPTLEKIEEDTSVPVNVNISNPKPSIKPTTANEQHASRNIPVNGENEQSDTLNDIDAPTYQAEENTPSTANQEADNLRLSGNLANVDEREETNLRNVFEHEQMPPVEEEVEPNFDTTSYDAFTPEQKPQTVEEDNITITNTDKEEAIPEQEIFSSSETKIFDSPNTTTNNQTDEQETTALDINAMFAPKEEVEQPSLAEMLRKKSPTTNSGNSNRFNISVNKRLGFIKHLFHNDEQAYQKALNDLNQSKGYIEALTYVNLNLRHDYNWREDDEHVRDFLQVIKRTFLG